VSDQRCIISNAGRLTIFGDPDLEAVRISDMRLPDTGLSVQQAADGVQAAALAARHMRRTLANANGVPGNVNSTLTSDELEQLRLSGELAIAAWRNIRNVGLSSEELNTALDRSGTIPIVKAVEGQATRIACECPESFLGQLRSINGVSVAVDALRRNCPIRRD